MVSGKLKNIFNYKPIKFENSKLAVFLLWFAFAAVASLRLFDIFAAGLTTVEADTLAKYSSSNIFAGLTLNSPFTVIVMRASQFCGTPPIYARLIFIAFSIWSLLLIISIAKKQGGTLAAMFALLLAGISADLISAAQEISVTSVVIWASLLTHLAFVNLIHDNKTLNIFWYILLSVIGVLFSPLISLLLLFHIVQFVFYIIKNKKNRLKYVIPATSALIISGAILGWQFLLYKKIIISSNDVIFLLPFAILFLALIISFIYRTFAHFSGTFGKIIFYSFNLILLFSFFVTCFFQYKVYKTKLQARLTRDLTSSSAFLEKAASFNDKIILVSNINVRKWFRTRYYFYDYLTTKAKAEYYQIDNAEWKTNFYHHLPNKNSKLWLVGIGNPYDYALLSNGYSYAFFPFALPVTEIISTSKWNDLEYLKLLHVAVSAAPKNTKIGNALLKWYNKKPYSEVFNIATNGITLSDLFDNAGDYLNKKAALNHILYSWNDYNISNYYIFDKLFSNSVKFGIDKIRLIHLYKIFAEKAIAVTNIKLAAYILTSAKKLDENNPFLTRIEAKIEALKTNKDYNKIVNLNNLAKKQYKNKFNDYFAEADYVNAIIYKSISNYAAAFKPAHNILSYYSNQKMPIEIKTNMTLKGEIARKKWENNRLAWIGRCNSLISSLLAATNDYENAILWETKNLDEHNSEARRITSRERLAKLYIKIGGINKAIQYFNSLANAATTTAKRISWKLEGAQLFVTIGDTVSTYDSWADLQKEIKRLPMEKRWKWSKDKRYQRILLYLSRRSKMDIRNLVLISMEKIAEKSTNSFDTARLYEQMAEIYKCKLQYDKAQKYFALSEKAEPKYFNSFLSDGILNYKMKRFLKAEVAFTNLMANINTNTVPAHVLNDWRYIILKTLVEKGEPPNSDEILLKIDNIKPKLDDIALYYNNRGNVLECYGKYDDATNMFTIGISTNKMNLENYLDLGYLICKRSDIGKAEKIIDSIMSLDLSEKQKKHLENDWRFVILHYISSRPYNLKE